MLANLSLDDPDRLTEMMEHVQAAPSIFRPAAFWTTFQQRNTTQLAVGGLDNFKRTINQNYFNWMPSGPDDNQFRNLLRLTAEYPSVDAFDVHVDPIDHFESFTLTNELKDRKSKVLYATFVGMLWQYTKLSCLNGLIDAIDEPSLGNPIPARLGGRLISQDVANSVRERNIISWPWESDFSRGRAVSFVEIGAGYGRLAYVFLSSAPVRYTIVDIPPALFVSQWYLSRLFPDRTIFHFRAWTDYAEVATEIAGAQICFLTPDQLALMPNNCYDAGTTISSLPEMTHAQVEMYLDLLNSKVKHYVYIKQWIDSENELDRESFTRSDFDMAFPWEKYVDRVDSVQDKFFETLWKRGS